jgi:hypothetical protein
MEKLDNKVLEMVENKMKLECSTYGREYIGYEFVAKCNHILVFKLLFSFRGGKVSKEQFNFDLCKAGLFNVMI